MWTVIYIASNKKQADFFKNLLCSEGVLANTRAVGSSASGDGMFEILVLESEVEEAHAIICQHAVN